VKLVAEHQGIAELLGAIPPLSHCAREVLDEYVRGGVVTLHSEAGQELQAETESENLYVLVAGSASLDAGDGVHVSLEPGDYFGGNAARRHNQDTVTAVVAVNEMDVIVIDPQQVQQLVHASSRSRHPSNIEWNARSGAPSPRLVRRHTRRPTLARSAS
jgi:CRP-like cAMP-binding protein